MFGIENLSWISAKSTLEASQRAEFLILQTGMTAFGKAYYRNQRDLVPNVSLFFVYTHFFILAVDNLITTNSILLHVACSETWGITRWIHEVCCWEMLINITRVSISTWRNHRFRISNPLCFFIAIADIIIHSTILKSVTIFSDVLLEKGEIKADEIWNIYNTAPRIPQVSYLSPSSLSVLIFFGFLQILWFMQTETRETCRWIWSFNLCGKMGNSRCIASWKSNIFTRKHRFCNIWSSSSHGGI